MTLSIVGFDDLVTSFVSTIATGRRDPCRVGLSPTGKPRLYTAHSAIAGTRDSLGGHRRLQLMPTLDPQPAATQQSPHPYVR